MVEANKRVRPDRVLQLAFGRDGCAEQSVISQPLDASTPENVQQMQDAMQTIYQRHSSGYQHDYTQKLQILDADMTGQPCGKKAAFATKGYFAHQRNRRGRQLGRALLGVATQYDEIVIDRLYDGKTQLPVAFQPLVTAAESVLKLDRSRRTRTVLRTDGGAGSQNDVNWALERGYHIHTKEYNGKRARNLAASVEEWHDDPKVTGRQIGWVTTEPTEYVEPVKRIAVRTRKKNGQWGIGVLISTLTAEEVIPLARLPRDRLDVPLAVLCAYVYFYDLRSGGVETQIKGDKQGLGITKRNKKRFEAQQMLIQFNALAHNLIIWARGWLQPSGQLQHFGIVRMVRDVFHVPGLVLLDSDNRILRIVLQAADPIARVLSPGLAMLLAQQQVAVVLDEI